MNYRDDDELLAKANSEQFTAIASKSMQSKG